MGAIAASADLGTLLELRLPLRLRHVLVLRIRLGYRELARLGEDVEADREEIEIEIEKRQRRRGG